MNEIVKNQAMAFHAVFGQRTRAARKRKGLSQLDVAERLGYSFQQLQKNEKGENRYNSYIIHQLKSLYGVSYDYLFEGISEQPFIPSLADNNLPQKEILQINRAMEKILYIPNKEARGILLAIIDEVASSYGSRKE